MTKEESEKELREEEVECILRFMLTGKPLLSPTDEVIFDWCIGLGYISYDENNNDKYVVTQKGLNHVSMR
jgi:hypothetical protein